MSIEEAIVYRNDDCIHVSAQKGRQAQASFSEEVILSALGAWYVADRTHSIQALEGWSPEALR